MNTRNILFAAALLSASLLPSPAQAADPNPPSIHSERGAWPIRRQWTLEEARHYGRWVEQIFLHKVHGTEAQKNALLEDILADPKMNLLLDPEFLGEGGNPPLPDSVKRLAHNVLDCGKLTAFFPAYYAYRRALPWMTAQVRSGGGDVRTSDGNVPVHQVNSFTAPSVEAFFRDALSGFSSGNYRVNLYGPNAEQSDSLPVAIAPEYLMPGCVNYIDGHCLLLARVDPYGELHFLNASTTRGRDIYTYNGMNTVIDMAPEGGDAADLWRGYFQGLRVFRYPIAEVDETGKVTAVRRRTNDEMRAFGFDLEQYLILQELDRKGHVVEEGVKVQKYHDLIRLRMNSVDRVPVLQYLEDYAGDLQRVYELREDFVQDAWRDYLDNGPIVYPEGEPDSNIFQAHGRWETWSSPSSDVDRRNKYFYLRDWALWVVRWFNVRPEFLDLTGLEKYDIQSRGSMARALVAEKNRIFAERTIHYRNSQGDPVRLTLKQIEERLHDLSFDPNHPPELRWGAPMGSPERATAPHTYTPVPEGGKVPMEEAYLLQTWYRTVPKRETETSHLRGMEVERFIRFMFDDILAEWYPLTVPSPAIREWLAEKEEAKKAAEPPPKPFVLVPRSPGQRVRTWDAKSL